MIMALNPTDACGFIDQSIPQWKRELIIRRRAVGRTLQVGSSSVKLTCPGVVALLRQPELLSGSENVSNNKKNHSPTSDDPTSSFKSLNQNIVDFHPSTSTGNSVCNMRLLDECSEVNKLVINGTDVKNKNSDLVSGDLCVNYNLIMGEDKSHNLKKRSATSRARGDYNNMSVNRPKSLMNQVSCEGTNGKPSKEEDNLSDSSEELQYGPGIVNKLKTKYLSMTLREQKRHLRPSLANLRRATSLENIVDGDGNLSKPNKLDSDLKIKFVSVINKTHANKPLGLSSHRMMKHLGNYSNETMKRARSMDTLLKSECRTHIRPIASIVNENVVIVENSPVNTTKETSERDDKSPKHRKQTENKELPPPDVVKQTLKIFETSPKKKVKPCGQTNIVKLVAGFSNSTSNPKSSNLRSCEKTKASLSKPSLSPKPIFSPEKLKQNRSRIGSPKKSLNATSGSSVCSPTKVCKTIDVEQNERTSSLTVTTMASPNATSTQSLPSAVTTFSNNEQISLTHSTPSSNKSDSFLNSSLNDSKNDIDETEEFEDVDSILKQVPQSALENIRRGGISMQFSFNSDNPCNASVSKSYLPRSKNPHQALNTPLLKDKTENPSSNIVPLRSHGSLQTKQVGIIRPLMTPKMQSSNVSTPTLTDQEIEKNLINRVKSIEQPISKVVVAIKSLPDNVVLGSVSSDIVANKTLTLPRVCTSPKIPSQKLWNEQHWHQNTIVFNFSDRKEVPDYIENDGLILKGKRDKPRPGEGGFILLDSAANDESSTDAEELLISDPPSPCDVTFEGDNVVINGKSNLKKSPKQNKLRIQFNDEATTMFEYPSEASMVEEELIAQLSASNSLSSGEEGISQASTSVSLPSTPAPSPGLPVSLGGSLGAYTPRQVSAGDWQLGMTPVHQPTSPPVGTLQTADDVDHLKPAPPESTVVWSEDTASDLLF